VETLNLLPQKVKSQLHRVRANPNQTLNKKQGEHKSVTLHGAYDDDRSWPVRPQYAPRLRLIHEPLSAIRRGFNEQGTTTTPFQMVVLNEISRYHIAMAALQRANRPGMATSGLIEQCRSALDSATAYAHAHFEDPPEIRDWIWDDVKKENKLS
jgi:hypothetical protein